MSNHMRVFVTGGAGYVGSHTVRALCAAGHNVVVFDNLSKGHAAAVNEKARLIVGDLEDRQHLASVLAAERVDAVMHFAASIEVGESVRDPLRYYDNNLANTIGLLRAVQTAGVSRFVFSSTCATYGIPAYVPITESMPQNPESPYARAKLAVEWALADSAASWGLGSTSLRYFNAAGASSDLSIGEDHDPETHLIPNILRVALGQLDKLRVFGNDYDTPDGTCIRDYVHVEDLADAHLKALAAIRPGVAAFYNCGTGRGASVRQIIDAAARVTGKPIPIEQCPRRPGDVPVLCADSTRIQRELNWTPRHTDLEAIVASAWAWHKSRPDGYADRPPRP